MARAGIHTGTVFDDEQEANVYRKVKKMSKTDESELIRHHASEMHHLIDEVGKITESN